MSLPAPPARWQRLLEWVATDEASEFVLGDLDEEFHRRALDNGPAAARRWYRRQVLRSLPSLARHRFSRSRNDTRAQGDSMLQAFLLDLRQSARALRQTPGFALVAVSTLALGVGANGAIFSILDAVILRPLPFPQAEQLVLVHNHELDAPHDRNQISIPDYRDLAERTTQFSHLAAWEPTGPSFTGQDVEPTRLVANSVTASMFDTLGLQLPLGRGFTAEEDTPGAPRVAVLSHGFWRRRFDASPDVLGTSLRLNGQPYEVVGVLPASLERSGGGDMLPDARAQLWIPWETSPSGEVSNLRGIHRARVVARLAPGANLAAALDETRSIARDLAQSFPDSNAEQGMWVEPARDSMVHNVRSTLNLLFGAVGLVLLLVCTNVSSLLLGRSVARQSELAVRSALGAGLSRLFRQLFTESLVLAVAGGLAGIAVAWGLLRVALVLAPSSIPRLGEAGLQPHVMAYCLGLATVSALVFGTAPALRAARRGTRSGIKARTFDERPTLRQALVVAQVAMAVVLLLGAGLLLRSFWAALNVDPGFRDDGLVAVSMELDLPYVSPEWPRAVTFYADVAERVRALPGVVGTAAAYRHPLDAGWGTTFRFQSRPEPAPGNEPDARFRPVTPGYFTTVGATLLEGRAIDARDVASAPGAVVVNESFVRTYFEPEQTVLGERIDYTHWWNAGPDDYEIVGVVADVRFEGRSDTEPRPALYFAHAQQPIVEMNLLVRHTGPLDALLPLVREAIWGVDPEMPLDRVLPMDALLDHTLAQRRFTTSLLTAFAAVALLLSALGTYGMLAFSVQRRSREIGVRIALGANASQVTGQVIRKGLLLVGLGCALGVLGGAGLSGALASQLYGVERSDPWTLLGVPGLLTLVALLASWIPAQRAARIDPARTLRQDD